MCISPLLHQLVDALVQVPVEHVCRVDLCVMLPPRRLDAQNLQRLLVQPDAAQPLSVAAQALDGVDAQPPSISLISWLQALTRLVRRCAPSSGLSRLVRYGFWVAMPQEHLPV